VALPLSWIVDDHEDARDPRARLPQRYMLASKLPVPLPEPLNANVRRAIVFAGGHVPGRVYLRNELKPAAEITIDTWLVKNIAFQLISTGRSESVRLASLLRRELQL